MSDMSTMSSGDAHTGLPPKTSPGTIPLYAFGMSLGLFFAITFVLCVGYGLFLVPAHPMYPVWAPLLPGFTWLSWPSFFLGLVETFAYGWYGAIIFVPLYNFFQTRTDRANGR